MGKYYTLYVPKKLRADVCYNNHDDPLAGNCGINKTYDRIKDKYYWPGMLQHITNYVKSCINCLHRKTPKTAPAGLLQPIPVEAPFKRVGIDVIGPVSPAHGKKYIIVATDYFTKWAETRALSSQTAKSTAKFLLNKLFVDMECQS